MVVAEILAYHILSHGPGEGKLYVDPPSRYMRYDFSSMSKAFIPSTVAFFLSYFMHMEACRQTILMELILCLIAIPLVCGEANESGNAIISARRTETHTHSLSLSRTSLFGQQGSLYSWLHIAGSTDLVSIEGTRFVAEVSFGSQVFPLVVDTGSSDTWVVSQNFTCLNFTTQLVQPQNQCFFGPSKYQEDPGAFQRIPDQHVHINYGSGESIVGRLGYTNVSLDGITVHHQEVAIAETAGWNGDSVSSGVLGLAFSSLTSAYPGINDFDDTAINRIYYSGIMETIFLKDKLVAPLFTLAISRDEANTTNGGTLTLGGFPDLTDPTINSSSTLVTADIEALQSVTTNNSASSALRYYVVNATVPRYSDGSLEQFLVDTGTTTIYVRNTTAAAYNVGFNPPTWGFEDTGIYFVNCTAKPPPFAVRIDEYSFDINPMDLVVDAGYGLCASGVQSAGNIEGQPSILGDVFLKNVLAVFDVGAEKMSFASRVWYES